MGRSTLYEEITSVAEAKAHRIDTGTRMIKPKAATAMMKQWPT